VSPEDSGKRLDQFLAAALPEHSRSRWQKAIEGGEVRVDGRVASAGLKLKAGMEIEAGEPASPPSTLEPEALELRIVFEDDALLVVDKPAGLAVHPGAGRWSGTLANALVHRFRDLPVSGGSDRPGIVHRLDRDTSGLLIVARTEQAHRRLSRALAERTVERRYWGMVWGDPGEAGVVEAPVGRDPRVRVRMAVVSKGRPAATEYRRIHPYGFASEMEFKLRTGRTHQIRVHLAHLRHPVVGDATYGDRQNQRLTDLTGYRAARQMLHAFKLSFVHPRTGKRMGFEAPLPEDFVDAVEALRQKAQ
jgi:23S rRNA pseudouridine1911/1915/1917 synthase